MKDEYELKWADYKRLCKFGKYTFIALVTVPFLLVAVFGLLLHFSPFQFPILLGNLPFVIGIVLMFVTLYFAWSHYIWECPRCSERFGRFHEECQNCGLPKWASENDLELTAEDVAAGKGKWPQPRI
jgi:hypothetical protein